jgi:protein TonB
VSGVVILEATIGADGHVADVRPLRSIPILTTAASNALKGWEFTPTLLNGQPVAVVMTATFQFTTN